jgi:NAD(P)-dependent dehydrogenase (short-subunit alcohol dehydrogenase family)
VGELLARPDSLRLCPLASGLTALATQALHPGNLSRPSTLTPCSTLQNDLRGARLNNSGEEAYVQAKTLLLMATRELARRLEGTGVNVIAGV